MGFILQLLGGGTPAKPKPKPLINPPYTAQQENIKWRALAPLIKKHFKTDMDVKDIAAELSYQSYLQSLKKNKDK